MENFLLQIDTGEIILLILIGLIPVALWVWALVDIFKGTFKSDIVKIIWIVIVIFAPVIGVIAYLIFGRSQKVSHT